VFLDFFNGLLGRKRFQQTVSIVRRQDAHDLWMALSFVVFDAPAEDGGFESRMAILQLIMEENQPPYAKLHRHWKCRGRAHMQEELDRIEELGGEGLMLRQFGSTYEAGRSATLLKVKHFHDAEAVVVGHETGSGRHRGRLGALLVQMADGTRFAVGTGLSDAERDTPPVIGSVINFKYQELSEAGVPRFPTYGGIRSGGSHSLSQGEPSMQGGNKRRFEFVEGSSSKFWEICITGSGVQVQFGRIGTAGQSSTKSFTDGETAQNHADKVIREKLAKGYAEVAA
jgi:DNA ligase-1